MLPNIRAAALEAVDSKLSLLNEGEHSPLCMVFCRIEALVGQADVRKVALGHEHTLILDAEGAVFSCGNNLQVGIPRCKGSAPHFPVAESRDCGQGQCGHGTPLQDIADQQRADWEVGYAQLHGGASQGQAAWGPSAAQGTQVWNTPQQEQRMAWAHSVRPHTLQAERASEVDIARRCAQRSTRSFEQTLVQKLCGAREWDKLGLVRLDSLYGALLER